MKIKRRFGRTAPLEPGQGTADNGGAPAPVAPAPAQPAAFDPNTLTPEAKAYLDAQLKAEREKARGFDKANAAKAERESIKGEFAKLLGLAPGEADPQKVAAELEKAREDNRIMKVESAVERAARAAGADDDLVTAKLHRDGTLKSLDPAEPGFTDRVKAAVDEVVKNNPRLKLETAPALPPAAGRAPVAPPAGSGTGEQGKRPGLHAAIGKAYSK